jgi:hypothetical protein
MPSLICAIACSADIILFMGQLQNLIKNNAAGTLARPKIIQGHQ